MNALLVDTSAWISYLSNRGEPEIDLALEEGRVYLSPVVAAELLSGKLSALERTKLTRLFRELPVCGADLEHWIRVGNLHSTLLTKNLLVSTPDAHIAQCALDLDCYLLSEDKVFARIAKATDLRLYRN